MGALGIHTWGKEGKDAGLSGKRSQAMMCLSNGLRRPHGVGVGGGQVVSS